MTIGIVCFIATFCIETACSKSGADTIPPNGCIDNYNEAKLLSNGWTKIFEDQFDNTLSKWDIWNGGAYNNELQFYQPENIQLVDGSLQITAKKQQVIGPTLPTNPSLSAFEYTSGRIESKMLFSANPQTPRVRIAARIKLPAGYGMWPAFWSYGTPWPTEGEIDFVEARGQEPMQYTTNYYYGNTAGIAFNEDASKVIQTSVDLTACYHIYEMEWTANALLSYFDGQLVETKTLGTHIPDLFGKKEKLVLNLAVGGGFFPSLNPALIQTGSMYVDWVKVFVQ